MRKFGQEGDLHRKASSFFLQAARWCGIPLSPLLVKKGSLKLSEEAYLPDKRTKPAFKKLDLPNDPVDAMDASRLEPTGVRKVIPLDNDATSTLVFNRNLGELPSAQRRFVNKMIDEMEQFLEELIAKEEESERKQNVLS